MFFRYLGTYVNIGSHKTAEDEISIHASVNELFPGKAVLEKKFTIILILANEMRSEMQLLKQRVLLAILHKGTTKTPLANLIQWETEKNMRFVIPK